MTGATTFSIRRLVLSLFVALALCAISKPARAQGAQLDTVQGVLAMQGLDGWLVASAGGKNPVAAELAQPDGKVKRQWFYFIPAFGQASLVVHKSELAAFDRVPGTKVAYAGYRDLRQRLGKILNGASFVAMEYAPDSRIDSLTRIDAATANMVKKLGVTIESSAALVQYTKAQWRPEGRLSHYLVVHHLTKLRDEAFALIASRFRAGKSVSEGEVHSLLEEGFKVRGIRGEFSVAFGEHTAKPNYQSRPRSQVLLRKGDLVLLRLRAASVEGPRPIFAAMSWVGVAEELVPERVSRVFATVAKARDAALALVRDRLVKGRLVQGYEVGQAARKVIGDAGLASRFVHRSGHSLDTSLNGDGANLDDYETHDTRNLIVGTGFALGPGIYAPGDMGIQSEVSVFLSQKGPELTTPLQSRVTPILR